VKVNITFYSASSIVSTFYFVVRASTVRPAGRTLDADVPLSVGPQPLCPVAPFALEAVEVRLLVVGAGILEHQVVGKALAPINLRKRTLSQFIKIYRSQKLTVRLWLCRLSAVQAVEQILVIGLVSAARVGRRISNRGPIECRDAGTRDRKKNQFQ
jgi:hypothetical protein